MKLNTCGYHYNTNFFEYLNLRSNSKLSILGINCMLLSGVLERYEEQNNVQANTLPLQILMAEVERSNNRIVEIN